MKELEIGETITIKCVEGKEGYRCSECILAPEYDCTLLNFPCSSYERKDHKNVHFEIADTSVEIDTKVANLVSMRLADERKIWMEKVMEWLRHFLGVGNVTSAFISSFCKYMEESK